MSTVGKEENFVSVVAYIHNDASLLEEFLDKLSENLMRYFKKCELIIVNDYSQDDGVRIVKEFVQKKPEFVVSIVNMSFFHGVEAAITAGVDLAIGDYVFEFEHVNLDYPDDMMMKIYNEALKGYDVVSAVPDKKSYFTALGFYFLYNKYKTSMTNNKLCSETFRVVSRRAINRINSMGRTIPYRKLMYINSGLPVNNLVYKPITSKKYKLDRESNKQRLNLALDSFMLFTTYMQRLSGFICLLFFIIAIGMCVYSVCSYVRYPEAVGTWAGIMGFVAIAMSGIFLILSILIRYMSLILDTVFRKNKYTIESINKLSK